MSDGLRILIIGGYGTFGGRIVELLEDEPRLTLVVAGRSAAKAGAFCRTRTAAGATLVPAAFDRDGDVRAQIAAIAPGLVIDASGPFQAYQGRTYHVIEACAALGVNYLDLADGSNFVAGVGAYDAEARAAGVYALSGVSSFPVLTAAAARRLSAGMAQVRTIRGGVAPSPFAGVGLNVIRAIAGYAGQKVGMRRDGADGVGRPFTEQMRFTIAPPGRLPLRSTLFSLVDVPDLRALTALWPEAETVWMGAGPVPELLHRALIACAWLVRAGLSPSLSPLAPLMAFATKHFRWGEHRGGMFVEVSGVDAAGARVRRSWHLLAEGADGPLIPSMAVEAIVRGALEGRSPSPGARAAIRELELEDYERLFARRTIYTGFRDAFGETGAALYPSLLGSAYAAFAAQIRDMHDPTRTVAARGRASVERGRGLLSRLIGGIVGFPKAAADTPVTVTFDVAGGIETWTRDFGGQRFASDQFAGRGRWERLLCERFGPLTFAMAVIADSEGLTLVLRGWRAFGAPMPAWLGPRIAAREIVDDGRFRFHVEIGHPLAGLIVRYDGWLVPDTSPPGPPQTEGSR